MKNKQKLEKLRDEFFQERGRTFVGSPRLYAQWLETKLITSQITKKEINDIIEKVEFDFQHTTIEYRLIERIHSDRFSIINWLKDLKNKT